MTELAALRRDVPDDVVVLTRYDGVRARTSSPQLTAVDLHLGTAAARAVDLLVELVGGSAAELSPVPPQPVPTLVVRASSERGGQDQRA